MNKIVLPFNRDTDWAFKKKRNKFDTRGDDAFVKWLLALLKSVSLGQKGTAELPEGYKWNALCVYMNQDNLEYLRGYIDPMTYLGYSPKTDESLGENELAVDIDDLFEKQA